MTKLSLIRASVAVVTSMGFAGGLGIAGVSAAPPPHGLSTVNVGNGNTTNANEVGTTSNTSQAAVTGSSTVFSGFGYSSGSKATTGASSNSSAQTTAVGITDTVATDPPASHSQSLNIGNGNVTNENEVETTSNTSQFAKSGNATVVGGSHATASTGAASNSSTESTTVTIN